MELFKTLKILHVFRQRKKHKTSMISQTNGSMMMTSSQKNQKNKKK